MSALFSFILLAGLLVPGAARAEEADSISKPVNLWPLVYQEKGPDRMELEILFSLIYYEQDRDVFLYRALTAELTL